MSEFNARRLWGPQPTYHAVSAVRQKHAKDLVVLAGPCSVESQKQMSQVIPALKKAGVTYARGGVYRAGTYPRADGNFGLQHGLMYDWAQACREAGLKVVMECLDVRQISEMELHCDAFQVGARHMQDYALLSELAHLDRPVFLKRNVGATMDEFLGAAEYLARGSCRPHLIERGSATHMNHCRWDLSISIIPAIKCITGIPVLVDASHGTGRRDLVEPMTLAGIAAGADGFLVEVHPDPMKSLSDADQALDMRRLGGLARRARAVRKAANG